MAAQGDVLPPESRIGLALFLRHGMWAWAQTLAAPSTKETPIPASSSAAVEPYDRTLVIQLLAAIAMKIDNQRSP
jgi:hypothetical protein